MNLVASGLQKSNYLALAEKLNFSLSDELVDLLVTYTKSLQQDLALLQSFDVEDISLHYCLPSLLLSMGTDTVSSELDSVDLLKSLTSDFKIPNIETKD